MMSPIMSLYKYISTHAYITIYLIHIICDRKEKNYTWDVFYIIYDLDIYYKNVDCFVL